MENNSDYKKYLQPEIVSKLNSLDLKAKYVVEGFMVGLHKSPYHGFSAEFTEHRPYMQGDGLKDIDWKVYGKTEKYYVKQYEEETNLKSFILLDVSKSMNYTSGKHISKLEYGKLLAASLSYLMVKQQDATGLALYSDKIEKIFEPRANRIYFQEILKAISGVKGSSTTNSADCLTKIAEKIKKRGLVVIISDFFDDIDSVINSIRHFRHKKNEVIVFQVLDPLEVDFAFGKDAIFKDIETGEEITTQPYQIQKAYKDSMHDFIQKLKNECLNSNIEYNQILTTNSFENSLFSYLQKRKKLI